MGPGKKNVKATKKFEKKHLRGVLDKRKDAARAKQRQQVKEKKKARRADDADFFKGPKAADGAAPKREPHGGLKNKKSGEMSVDEFFQGGFEEIVGAGGCKPGRLGKRKRSSQDVDQDVDQDAEADASDGSGSGSGVEAAGRRASDDDDDGADDDSADGDDAQGGMSRETMDKLAEKDPEFYRFLQENDPEALDFDDNTDLAEVDELSASEGGDDSDSDDDDDDDDEGAKEQKPKKKRKTAEAEAAEPAQADELTRPRVASWRKAMQDGHSLRAARQVVLAFRCAAHLNQDGGDGDGDGGDAPPRWTINDPQVYHDVLVLALTQVPAVMNHHLPVKESAAGKVYVPTETKKFKTLSLLLRSYASSVMHLLGTLSDDKTVQLALSSVTPVLPYLLSFKKLVRALARAVVGFWAQPASAEATRVTAFLVLRRLVAIGDKAIREAVLKATYQGFVQGCRVTNHSTVRGINLMKNSAAELWGLDPAVGYATAFTLIRQLAVHLRNSLVNNRNESFRLVYNWQFAHSLDFWSCVLAEHCCPLREAQAGRESPLRLLIYPLVQVTLGAARLVPTSAYFPLRFHLVRSLLRTSRATGTYIPLASPLLEVLASAEMKKAPKASTLKSFDFAVAYRAPKSYLRTRVYQDGVGEQVVELLGDFFLLWSTSVAFPELALPVVIQLKRWVKQARSRDQGNKNAKLVSQLVLLAQKLEANAKFIEDRRAKVEFAPKHRQQVAAFLKDFDVAKTPLGAYVVAQRKVREERSKMLEDARKEDDKKRKEDEAQAQAQADEDDHTADEEEDSEDGHDDDGDGDEDEDDE
ncbi:uncharacterized protein UV8b_01610 [Ustilaginoidea virens]|uniref:Uncharacterized protein n=1 Tax=Ustilaginoidea virens TaxID=1159556 RepID=A0A063C2H7_USTVR|nr:uncharacterized protein UV8b_01610 [Ustilaginoidea virens]QUC17369.1 hypothetical protein UV8b_01610 [Ustilaginoidea virens]GAO13744.1 hypothetical protein UVI_02018410 [Ustilaginoidea virens]